MKTVELCADLQSRHDAMRALEKKMQPLFKMSGFLFVIGLSMAFGSPAYAFITPGPDADNDHDGHIDDEDNCPFHYNPDQANCDDDHLGDACDVDNGTWSLVYEDLCFISDGGYNITIWGVYRELNAWTDRLYEDVSSCQSEDKEVSYRQDTRCWLFDQPTDDWDCCVTKFGYNHCSDVFENDECAY